MVSATDAPETMAKPRSRSSREASLRATGCVSDWAFAREVTWETNAWEADTQSVKQPVISNQYSVIGSSEVGTKRSRYTSRALQWSDTREIRRIFPTKCEK